MCTFVSKVLAVLSNHFLNYHHCGALLSCVSYLYVLWQNKFVYVCVSAWQVSIGLLFLSYLKINLLILPNSRQMAFLHNLLYISCLEHCFHRSLREPALGVWGEGHKFTV